jgi:hypothetical protein
VSVDALELEPVRLATATGSGFERTRFNAAPATAPDRPTTRRRGNVVDQLKVNLNIGRRALKDELVEMSQKSETSAGR